MSIFYFFKKNGEHEFLFLPLPRLSLRPLLVLGAFEVVVVVDFGPRSFVEAVARGEAVVEDRRAAGAVEAVVGDLDPPAALFCGPPPRFLLLVSPFSFSPSAALSFRFLVEESLSSALELRSFILFFGALFSSLSSSSSSSFSLDFLSELSSTSANRLCCQCDKKCGIKKLLEN